MKSTARIALFSLLATAACASVGDSADEPRLYAVILEIERNEDGVVERTKVAEVALLPDRSAVDERPSLDWLARADAGIRNWPPKAEKAGQTSYTYFYWDPDEPANVIDEPRYEEWRKRHGRDW